MRSALQNRSTDLLQEALQDGRLLPPDAAAALLRANALLPTTALTPRTAASGPVLQLLSSVLGTATIYAATAGAEASSGPPGSGGAGWQALGLLQPTTCAGAGPASSRPPLRNTAVSQEPGAANLEALELALRAQAPATPLHAKLSALLLRGGPPDHLAAAWLQDALRSTWLLAGLPPPATLHRAPTELQRVRSAVPSCPRASSAPRVCRPASEPRLLGVSSRGQHLLPVPPPAVWQAATTVAEAVLSSVLLPLLTCMGRWQEQAETVQTALSDAGRAASTADMQSGLWHTRLQRLLQKAADDLTAHAGTLQVRTVPPPPVQAHSSGHAGCGRGTQAAGDPSKQQRTGGGSGFHFEYGRARCHQHEACRHNRRRVQKTKGKGQGGW